MSSGSRSTRCAPMPGAGTSPTVPSARPIGPFLGFVGAASSQRSRIGEGRFKATMGFATTGDHSVNDVKPSQPSRQTGWKIVQDGQRQSKNGVPGSRCDGGGGADQSSDRSARARRVLVCVYIKRLTDVRSPSNSGRMADMVRRRRWTKNAVLNATQRLPLDLDQPIVAEPSATSFEGPLGGRLISLYSIMYVASEKQRTAG
jgi:hypothetical protein